MSKLSRSGRREYSSGDWPDSAKQLTFVQIGAGQVDSRTRP